MISAAARLRALFEQFEAETRAIVSSTIDAPASGLTLGETIAQERRAAGLSLDDVAKRCGLGRGHIWELEKGSVVNPTVSSCAAIATALGMSFETVCHAALLSYQRGPRGSGKK